MKKTNNEQPTQINWRAPVDLVQRLDRRVAEILAMTGITVSRQQLTEAAVRDFYCTKIATINKAKAQAEALCSGRGDDLDIIS